MDGESVPLQDPVDPSQMDSAMDGQTSPNFEGMDGEMDPAEDGMDGMDYAHESENGEESEDQQPAAFDVTKEPRCQWMIQKYINELTNFDSTAQRTAMDEYRTRLLCDFLDNPSYTRLFVWVGFEAPFELQFSYDLPPRYDGALSDKAANYSFCYFIKAEGNNQITREDIESQLVCELIETDPLDDLLGRMNNEFINRFLGENDWPEGVKKDFIASLHTFMMTITEHSMNTKGKTQLYIPSEDLNDIDTAATDKDLLQRLETTVIFWTRQIKELVSNQDVNNQGESTTPLDEIKHWEDRNKNLSNISQQLKLPKLKKITDVLEKAQSAYLGPFMDLTKEIDKGHEEANDNLQFLGLLSEPCKKIEQAQPRDIPKLLEDVLNNVRIIFELSKHYNTMERMKSLLTKIGNQIIQRCCKKINKDDMLTGDVEKCMRDLDESIECCNQWRTICMKTQRIIKVHTTSDIPWTLSEDNDDKNNTIFAENEAFIQRCKELKEICEGQLQFAQKGANSKMPIFGGSRGEEWTTSLNELKNEFERYLTKIKELNYDILDYTKTKWHEDYGQVFKEQVKSIENIYNTIILMTFKYVSTIQDAVEMLENFYVLAKRPTVIEFVQNKAAAEVYRMFDSEIKEVQELFDSNTNKKNRPPMPYSHPQYAGMAIWVKSLISRIDKGRDQLDQMDFINKHHKHEMHDKAIDKYKVLRQQLDDHISKEQFDSWQKTFTESTDKGETEAMIERALATYFLDKSTLDEKSEEQRAKERNKKPEKGISRKKDVVLYILKNNFNSKLLKILIEVTYWNKYMQSVVTIPHTLGKLVMDSERLRLLRENVMITVRDYNNIIVLINDRERKLFEEHLGALNKAYELGFKKHNWNTSQDGFINNCRNECKVQSYWIKLFQTKHRKIEHDLHKIQNTLLVKIAKKCYDLPQFLEEQKKVMKQNMATFKTTFEDIRSELYEMYSTLFMEKGTEIQKEWLNYIEELDKKLRKALQNSVKASLHDLQKHIKRDSQNMGQIFRIDTISDSTEKDQDQLPVKHDPDYPKLKISLTQFIKDIVQCTAVVPKLETVFRKNRQELIESKFREALNEERAGGNNQMRDLSWKTLTEDEKRRKFIEEHALPLPQKNSKDYVEKISKNEEINSYSITILNCVDEIKQALENDSRKWKNQSFVTHLHSLRTERGKKRLIKQVANTQSEDTVSKYKSNIEQLEEVLTDIRNEPSVKKEGFIEIDASKLKADLVELGVQCINYIFEVLAKQSKGDLQDFRRDLQETIHELQKQCETTEQLKKNMRLMKEVKENKEEMKARIQPIKQKFQFLLGEDNSEFSNIELTDEEKDQLQGIDDEWIKFTKDLNDATQQILKNYAQQKEGAVQQLDDFRRMVVENRDAFSSQAPKSMVGIDNKFAIQKIDEFRDECKRLREMEEGFKFQFDIFDEIDIVEYKELNSVERENDLLYKIWQIKNNWDDMLDEWNPIQFFDLESTKMENAAIDVQAEIIDIELQPSNKEVKSWPLTEVLKNEIKRFIDTIPLIEDLRHVAMRERHWNDLRIELKDEFRERDREFNLHKVRELNLLEHQDRIQELCDNAKKQLDIETSLDHIKMIWEEDDTSNLDVIRLRSTHDNEEFFKIHSTEIVMQLIEEHSNQLAKFKSSPYYREFAELIDFWEGHISAITETLEMLMTVQSMWLYLESIFCGQADIQQLLPKEHGWFIKVNGQFKTEMARIYKEKKCYEALVLSHGQKEHSFLKTLIGMQRLLEDIKKNLNQFLEKKRLDFPRFFFLSNEDLLEIIGQARDPAPVNKHIGKIFEGIKELVCGAPTGGAKTQKTYTITSIRSPDEEELQLKRNLPIEQKVEQWLQSLMDIVKETLQSEFYKQVTNVQNKKVEKDKLKTQIKQGKGQILLTVSMIEWTRQVEEALRTLESQPNSTKLKKVKQDYKKKVQNLVEIIEDRNLGKTDRLKVTTLIILEEHNREVVERLLNDKTVTNQHNFNWVSQLRYFKGEDTEGAGDKIKIEIRQLNAKFEYGYEYQGNNGRLVVTPLTDRAYMTLTNALDMKRGGAPQGPAGTGKTETVKDLGKNLAYYVVIQNCAPEMTHETLASTFIGLGMAGCWGCFDEFNRILLDVLSVITTYIDAIFQALKKGNDTEACSINEKSFNVSKDCGLFITMNPGYAGRQQLPDNLAALFRPVAMMVPDYYAIAKIELMAEGFQLSDKLAGKITTIYELMSKQLSKQSHYDYGMRAIKSVLRHSGRVKRENKSFEEIQVVIKAIRDMNLARFLAEDVQLFDNLFIDLFPGQDEPDLDLDELQIQIEQALLRNKLELNENIVVKCMQLYETKCTRHGNMLIGPTFSGKTTTWKILEEALCALHEKEKKERAKTGGKGESFRWLPVKHEAINPKAVSLDELFGSMKSEGGNQVWKDGILQKMLKDMCESQEMNNRWMIMDGPVDTLWIETMNSVLDDSKLLTLTNGDRIKIPEAVRLLFEVEDLTQASPATVSRAGMIYLDIEELPWKQTIMESWIKSKAHMKEDFQDRLRECVNSHLEKVMAFKKATCKELVQTSESACIRNFCNLFDQLSDNFKFPADGKEDREGWLNYVEKWFVFAMIWSVCCTVDFEDRKEIENIIRDGAPTGIPLVNTVFDYFIEPNRKDFQLWAEKIPKDEQKYFKDKKFNEIQVQTIDFVRNRYVVEALLKQQKVPILLIGESGVGKTSLIDGILRSSVDQLHQMDFTLNFSAGTTSNSVQEIIESYFQKGSRNKWKPKNSKSKAICFIDDLNMPRVDIYGSQPPLELIRQFLTYEQWYDRTNIVRNEMANLQILSCMGLPGGGRAHISNRVLSRFHVINYTELDDTSMLKIYKTIADYKFQGFTEDIKCLTESLAMSTIELFKKAKDIFKPTPSKSHYLFNMRDISKIFEGLYLADKNFVESKEQIVKMWSHEVLRVFYDRLIDTNDQNTLIKSLNEQLESNFQMNYSEHCRTGKDEAIFANFLQDDVEKRVYDEVTDIDKMRNYLNQKLADYNEQRKVVKMNIVLFRDAIIHITKIYRVINFNRGHCLLVGVGGSGRHSLSRLSAYISDMISHALQIRSDYSLKDFRNELQEMYKKAVYSVQGQPKKTTFIFSDNDVVDERFLEDIQNQLNGGIVPNIYNSDELFKIKDEKFFKMAYKRDGQTTDNPDYQTDWFYRRIKDSMHMSICMSPIGERFRNYTRNYPALINNTTIDWFMPWPEQALTEVANKFINEMDIDEKFRTSLAEMAACLHKTSQDEAENMKRELRRIFYVTPTNFIELLKGYKVIIEKKREEIGHNISKLDKGLGKLAQASKEVAIMTDESKIAQEQANELAESNSKAITEIKKSEETVNIREAYILKTQEEVGEQQKDAERIKEEAQYELDKAQPACDAAEALVQGLDNAAIGEIKNYASPPKDIERVMNAVMILLGKPTGWANVKKEIQDIKFRDKIVEYKKENVSKQVMKDIQKFTSKDDFTVAYMTKKSAMAGSLCAWVRAVEEYNKAWQIVKPKKEKLAQAEEKLRTALEQLEKLEAEFKQLKDQLEALQEDLKEKLEFQKQTEEKLNDLKKKIEAGDRLITGLADEKENWTISLAKYREDFNELIGNCILAAAYMSYAGPFPANFRERLHKKWLPKIKKLVLPHKKDFTFIQFMVKPEVQQEWQTKGLPTDDFSNENGIFATKGLRWALNIDPQSQAKFWLKSMYSDILKVADPKEKNYLKKIENALSEGHTLLLEDIVSDNLDPSLDNVLNKNYERVSDEGRGKQKFKIKLGDKEILFNDNFRFLMTTRRPNPHYTPEVSTKVAVINFTVVESGLEEQCIGIVVKAEQPQLEEQRISIIKSIAESENEILNLQDQILLRLQNSDKDLLGDTELMNKLQSSKDRSADIKQQLELSATTMKRINENRDQFKSCAKKAAALFFVLNDLNKINPMYQFGLDKYKELFKHSIDEKDASNISQPNDTPTVKIEKVHTLNVYKNTCKSLFERHKLLLSLSMCVKLQMAEGKIDEKDYDFFLRGGSGMDSNEEKEKKPPHDWIKQTTWEQLLELQKERPEWAAGIGQAVNLSAKEWKHWYQSINPEPEDAQLPGEWVTRCEDPIRKMIILRCFRTDRVNFAVRSYVKDRMKSEEYIKAESTTIRQIYEETEKTGWSFQPILVILSSGNDPTADIQNLQKEKNIPKLLQVSLGKGQGKKAQTLLEESCNEGYWVFLSNCHLSTNLLPELESSMDDLIKRKAKHMHKDFRIFMSAVPDESFPISLLQRSLKIAQEPPRGIKENIKRLYGNMEKEFTECDQEQKFRKSVYGLCWFHTILIERKKFKTLGWNVSYSFNDSDYKVCEDTLANYFGRKSEDGASPENYDSKRAVPWQAIQQLIAQANYGGRVTDDRDRRLITTYAKEIFNEELVAIERWKPKGTETLNFMYPLDEANIKGSADAGFRPDDFLISIKEHMDTVDQPQAYGQHTNAEINSQISDSLTLLDSILSLQPAKQSTGGKSTEIKTLEQLVMLNDKLPKCLDVRHLKLKMKLQADDPLVTVLIQEVQRYNVLLEIMAVLIKDLADGINGKNVITDMLEKMMKDLSDNRVPKEWSNSYFSLRPLASWFNDLISRYEFFTEWASKGLPPVFMIGYFTYPTGFTTSLLQKFSRKPSGPAIDMLSFDFIPMNEGPEELKDRPPKDGAYIIGLYLEGANWDRTRQYLCEPNIMELEVEMPVIHFKPIQKNKTKVATSTYCCPTYYFPTRQGVVGRDSFMMNIDLKMPPQETSGQDHWIKRGTALLMSLKD